MTKNCAHSNDAAAYCSGSRRKWILIALYCDYFYDFKECSTINVIKQDRNYLPGLAIISHRLLC